MAVDELSEPLRPKAARKEPHGKADGGRAKGLRRAGLFAGILLLGTAVAAAFLLRTDPLGGEPVVVLDMEAPATNVGTGSSGLAFRTDAADDPGMADGGVAVITRLDSSNVDLSTPGSLAGGGTAGMTTDADRMSRPLGDLGSADQRVTEQANIGLLPRIGSNGEKPSEIYARPATVMPSVGSSEPARIALMIGGLGISASVTDEAIARLPEGVSLAFAPYGRDLQTRVDQARRAGHEVMLQIPMEPFDYPDNDPGPHTLLAEAGSADNLERLYWLMARFTGYFAVTNYMGAKFTADAEAIAPVQQELARRGLALLDDGSSQRSKLAATAGSKGLSAARADVVIDNAPSRQQIAAALKQLETLARERGYAIGTGTALPATIDAVAEWARELASRGVVIVPVSTALKTAQQS